jgi:hypothetical protein
MALFGEAAIAREVAIGVRLGDVPQFLAGHEGFIEGDFHGRFSPNPD